MNEFIPFLEKVKSRKLLVVLMIFASIRMNWLPVEWASPAIFLAVFYVGCETLIDITRAIWPLKKGNE